MSWLVLVQVGADGETHRYALSRTDLTHVELPSVWACTASAIRIDADGTERVTLDLTFADERHTYEAEQPANEPLRPPVAVQIPRTALEPLITILVGRVAPTDGGTRVRAAA